MIRQIKQFNNEQLLAKNYGSFMEYLLVVEYLFHNWAEQF